MKKLLTVFSTIFITSLILLFAILPKKVYAKNLANTEMYVPSSYIEFYDLNSPEDIHYSNNGYLIVSEFVEKTDNLSQDKSRLIIYNPNDDKYYVNETISYSVSCIETYENFILFLMNSSIYYIDVNNLTGSATHLNVPCHNFSLKINENNATLITLKSSTINSYILSIDNGQLEVSNESVVLPTVEPQNVLITDNGNIFYTIQNKELRLYSPSNKTNTFIKTLDTAIINMTQVNNYIYYTASDGVYKINTTSYEIEKIINTSSSNVLGALIEPTGITNYNGNILVADKKLNAIQEISTATNSFTNFAITTESTADFRLTNSATNLKMSENFLYALDSSSSLQKRIVKISKNSREKVYKKISLDNLYNEYPSFNPLTFTASDDKILLYFESKTATETKKHLALFNQIDGETITLEKVYEQINNSVTSLNYISNEFYFTDELDAYDTNVYININKITTENGVLIEKISQDKKIMGKLTHSCIDVFGNFYITYKLSDNKTYLLRYYDGIISNYSIDNTNIALDYNVLSVQTDFSGNVFILDDTNKVYRYKYNSEVNNFEYTTKNIVTNSNLPIKDIAINYLQNDFYALSNACILKNKEGENVLDIEHLAGISAQNVNLSEVLTQPIFITINKNAKIFKVTLNDYDNMNFKNIMAIPNPNTLKTYVVISELEDYYLISYSPNFYGLVRKSTVQSNIIPSENYENNKIFVTNENGEIKYVTNDTKIYSKPIIDDNFAIGICEKNQKVYVLKTVTFNNMSYSLISTNEDLTPTGYILNNYFKDEILQNTSLTSHEFNILDGDTAKKIKNTLAILLMTLSVTVTLLILEKKLLFNDKL